MKLVDALINLLKKKSTGEEVAAPEGVCPNCWGRTEYGGKFYEAGGQKTTSSLLPPDGLAYLLI